MPSRNDRAPKGLHWIKEPHAETPAERQAIEQTVREIIDAVRERGGAAVRDYSMRLDRWGPERFRVDRDEIDRAYEAVGAQGVSDIRFLHEQVAAFARAQLDALKTVEVKPHPGVTLGHRLISID